MILKIAFAFIFLILFQNVYTQDVKIVKMVDIENILYNQSDTIYILNFWASWCGPCIKELPIFDRVGQEYASQKIKVIFINLDKIDKLETNVKPILIKNSIKSTALLLDEPDPNTYIDQIDPEWSGALPFSIFLNNKKIKRKSAEKALSKKEIEYYIRSVK